MWQNSRPVCYFSFKNWYNKKVSDLMSMLNYTGIVENVALCTAVLSFNVIVVSVVLWYWTHTQKLQAMSLNDRSEGRQSKRSSPIKVIDIKYYKHILIIIYSFLFLGKNLEDFLKEKHISSKTGEALYYRWMLPSKVMPYLLRLAAPLTDSSIVHWGGNINQTKS